MNFEQKNELAQSILLYSRRYITQKCPILLAPIYALRDEVSEIPGPLATNGVRLWYDPDRVIQDFRASRNSIAGQLLHITIHCLMGHLAVRPFQKETALFDAAADWHTAQFLWHLDCGLGPSSCSLERSGLSLRCSLAGLLREARKDKETRRSLRQSGKIPSVVLDDHSRWGSPQRKNGMGVGAGGTADGAAGGTADGTADSEEAAPDWKRLQEEVASQAKQSQLWGSLSGWLTDELSPAEENGISYETFLKRFAVPNERLMLDPDSFDPRWYYLGLEQYGDIPLLEPSELSEPPAPDDLVIALDTSGSCSGDVCRRFLRETLSLLRDISAGAASFRVLALQCDTAIQRELLLESADQLDGFLKDFVPKGFGGTDFRPVFERVAQRQAEGLMPRIKGLLYLSDGDGDFPKESPGYPVTFLLLNEEWGAPDLPPWVTGLFLDQNDFTLKEASQ